MNPVDMYGNRIQVGDVINYPVRNGSSTYMRTAKVRGIRRRKNRKEKIETVLDAIVCIAPRWWERRGNWRERVRLRKVTISLPHRTTILPMDYVESDSRYSKLMDTDA